jgi:DNA polymerase II
MEYTGWLLDVFAPPERTQPACVLHGSASPEERRCSTCPGEGVVVWLLDEDGVRRRLHQPFPVTFYIAGPPARLRALQQHLEARPGMITSHWTERRDLFSPEPLPVLAIQVARPGEQPRLFQQVARQFPDLTYYDADVHLALRFAAAHNLFPLARCRIRANQAGCIESITPLDSPWELDPTPPPLRCMTIEPDSDPEHAPPSHLAVRCGRFDYHLSLEPARPLLVGLRALLLRHDPDLLLTAWGDTWLLPHLLKLASRYGIRLPLNREPGRGVARKAEHTYFSYGQIIYQGQQIHLFGRWHIDRYNAVLFNDYGLDGVQELARVTALPVQTAARVSPGTGISSMQILTALRMGVLVPWHKQQAERPKSLLDLVHADQGGLVYHPVIGLHRHVAEIDFISMYPTIMAHFNISPETVGPSSAITRAAQELDLPGEPAEPGLVPQTLSPLLEKRLALKTLLVGMPPWHPYRKTYKARASAHKWLLVTCFGYLGYKNARFGRIEAHEAVTAYGREALLRAKEVAEDQGCTVLHLYVDGMWVSKPGASTVNDYQPLLDEIMARTGLPVALDGIYRWLAFLPSRQDQRVPVANRYFGVFQDGTLKFRGIEARRRDTPPFIVQTQLAILEVLAETQTPAQEAAALPKIVALLRRRLAALQAGKLPLESLLVRQKLSRVLDKYRSPPPAARAVAQLQAVGKSASPGQRIRFLYTRGEPGVHAWDLSYPAEAASVDVNRYAELLLRAASTVLGPFGVSEQLLRLWLFSNAAYGAPPGVLPPRPLAGRLPGDRLPALPLWAQPRELQLARFHIDQGSRSDYNLRQVV